MTTLWNIFEDPSLLKTEGWCRRISALTILREGGLLPDGYGVAWYRPELAEVVICPEPWHVLYRWAYKIYWRYRGGYPAADDVLSRMYDAGRAAAEQLTHVREAEAYARGRSEGVRQALDQLDECAKNPHLLRGRES